MAYWFLVSFLLPKIILFPLKYNYFIVSNPIPLLPPVIRILSGFEVILLSILNNKFKDYSYWIESNLSYWPEILKSNRNLLHYEGFYIKKF